MSDVQSQKAADTAAMQPFQDYTTGKINQLNPQQSDQLAAATAGYNNFASTGGLSDSMIASLSGGGGGVADFSAPLAGYKSIAQNGGVDYSNDQATYAGLQNPNSALQSGITNSVSSLNNFGQTGGLTQADYAALNQPVFSEFAQTGGYSDTDLANIKKESNQVIPSYYSNVTDALKRQQAASGYGAGFSDANMAAMRQGAVDTGNQQLSTQINLQDAVRQGRMSAAQQLAANELGVIQYTTPSKEKALADAGQLNATQAQIMINAANGDVNAQNIIAQNKLSAYGGETAVATAQGNQANASAAIGAANARALAGLEQGGKEFGVSGLDSLYNSTNSQLAGEEKNMLSSIDSSASQQQGLLNTQAGLSNQPGSTAQGFSNVFKGIGSLASGLTGLSGLGGGGGGGGNTTYGSGGSPDDGTDPNTGKLYSEEDPTLNPANYDPYGNYNPEGGGAGYPAMGPGGTPYDTSP